MTSRMLGRCRKAALGSRSRSGEEHNPMRTRRRRE
jgi:hypothetical protein